METDGGLLVGFRLGESHRLEALAGRGAQSVMVASGVAMAKEEERGLESSWIKQRQTK